MLLIAFVVKEVDKAAECIIHIWYSALIRQSDFDILQQQIRPMIENVCQKTEGMPGSSLFSKTWAFGDRSLKLVLQKPAWDALLTFIDNRNGLTAEEAQAIRKAVTLAEESKDFRDRHLSFQKSNFHRVALTRFLEDGLLLPFGAPRDDFKHPNPSVMGPHAHQGIRRLTSFRTFFHATQTWPMPDNADPLHGWSPKAIQETSSGPAKADIYGKLFTYLRTLLRTFVNRLSCQQQFSFHMYHVDASALHDYLEAGSFSRIEVMRKITRNLPLNRRELTRTLQVSNIADVGFLGIHRTLECMIPLLQVPLVNPHATLITLLMNAVDEPKIMDRVDGPRWSERNPGVQRALKYLSPETDDCASYMVKFEFSKAAELAGAAMKDEHTVIEKWPFRLKLQHGQPGAQDEFDRLIARGVSSNERYIEWKRV